MLNPATDVVFDRYTSNSLRAYTRILIRTVSTDVVVANIIDPTNTRYW